MHTRRLVLIFCFIMGLTAGGAVSANTLFRADCSGLLTIDGKISIADDQDIEALAQIPRFPSAGKSSALLLAPFVIGHPVQVEIVDRNGRSFLRGEILGSRDDWRTFDLKEIETGVVLTLTAEHPALGARKIEFLGDELPEGAWSATEVAAGIEDDFLKRQDDLKVQAMRVKYESKMAWYRRWNGRFLRTTLYDRQYTLSRLEYLLSLNRVDEAMGLIRLDVDKTKVPAVAIHKTLADLRALAAVRAADPLDQQKLAALKRAAEAVLREQGESLGRHYGEYRAAYLKLAQIRENKKKLYSAQAVEAAGQVLENIKVVGPVAGLMPALLNLAEDPTLDYIQAAFFAQPYSLEAKLKRDLWAERFTFTWMLFNKVTFQEFFRRNVDGLVGKLPGAARSFYNSLRKSKRDMDARRFDLPQIERLAHLEGGAAAQVEELRKFYYGDKDTQVLKTFARLADREERLLWGSLKAAAPADFREIMEEEEKTAREWGELSKHYHRNEMNMTAAVMSTAGVGSGFLYHQYGSHDTWLWKGLDALIQLLPFVN